MEAIDHINNGVKDDNLKAVTRAENARLAHTEAQAARRAFEAANGLRQRVIEPEVNDDTVWRPIGVFYGSPYEEYGPFDHYEISDNGRIRKNDATKKMIVLGFNGAYHTAHLNLTRRQRRNKRWFATAIRVHIVFAHTYVDGFDRENANVVVHTDSNKTTITQIYNGYPEDKSLQKQKALKYIKDTGISETSYIYSECIWLIQYGLIMLQ